MVCCAAGESVTECSYVESSLTDVPFFASQIRLGPSGIEEYLPLPAMNDAEKAGFEALKAELQGSITKGVEFATQ
jgi:malate dehydrogenase